MKTTFLLGSLALASILPARAQMYQPAATRGAVLGAVAGAFIGGHNNDRWAEGAVIGGVAGALLGAVVAPENRTYVQPAVPVSQANVVYSQQGVVQPAPMVLNAPVAPAAPTVVASGSTQVVYAQPSVVYAQPQVVYVQPAPRVVYVEPAPRYYVRPPVIGVGFGYYSGHSHRGSHHRHGHR